MEHFNGRRFLDLAENTHYIQLLLIIDFDKKKKSLLYSLITAWNKLREISRTIGKQHN